MRIEATVPDSRGNALTRLSEELGLTRSQIVDEALSLFLKVVLEVRSGRRLLTSDPEHREADRELVLPTLTSLEWATSPPLLLTPVAAERMSDLIANPPPATEAMRRGKAAYEQRLAAVDPSRGSDD